MGRECVVAGGTDSRGRSADSWRTMKGADTKVFPLEAAAPAQKVPGSRVQPSARGAGHGLDRSDQDTDRGAWLEYVRCEDTASSQM